MWMWVICGHVCRSSVLMLVFLQRSTSKFTHPENLRSSMPLVWPMSTFKCSQPVRSSPDMLLSSNVRTSSRLFMVTSKAVSLFLLQLRCLRPVHVETSRTVRPLSLQFNSTSAVSPKTLKVWRVQAKHVNFCNNGQVDRSREFDAATLNPLRLRSTRHGQPSRSLRVTRRV